MKTGIFYFLTSERLTNQFKAEKDSNACAGFVNSWGRCEKCYVNEWLKLKICASDPIFDKNNYPVVLCPWNCTHQKVTEKPSKLLVLN